MKIRRLFPDRAVLDVDAKTTPHWQSMTYAEPETMTIDTRRTSSGAAPRHRQQGHCWVGDRLVEADLFSGIITHETSYLYLNDLGHLRQRRGVRLGALLRLTADEDDWATIAKNGGPPRATSRAPSSRW